MTFTSKVSKLIIVWEHVARGASGSHRLSVTSERTGRWKGKKKMSVKAFCELRKESFFSLTKEEC